VASLVVAAFASSNPNDTAGGWLNAELGFIDDSDIYGGSHLAFIHDKDVYGTGRFHCGNAVLHFTPPQNCVDHKSHKRYRNAHMVGGQKMPAKPRINFLLHCPQQINHAIVVAFGVPGRLALAPARETNPRPSYRLWRRVTAARTALSRRRIWSGALHPYSESFD
jgi:hypothetical protein